MYTAKPLKSSCPQARAARGGAAAATAAAAEAAAAAAADVDDKDVLSFFCFIYFK